MKKILVPFIYFLFLLCIFSVAIAAVTEVDLTGLATGTDTSHTHVYIDSYDANYHFKRCFICGDKKDIGSHDLRLIGNGPTCNVYVLLGRYVCSGCGFEKPVERLEHIRPDNIIWNDYCKTEHHSYQCLRCGGSGSNRLAGPHRFNYKNGTYTIFEIRDVLHEDPHTLHNMTCIDCNLTINYDDHVCYSNTCDVCAQRLAGYGFVSDPTIDLVNNTTDYVYVTVVSDIPGNEPISSTATATSLYGGNYAVGTPVLYSHERTKLCL